VFQEAQCRLSSAIKMAAMPQLLLWALSMVRLGDEDVLGFTLLILGNCIALCNTFIIKTLNINKII